MGYGLQAHCQNCSFEGGVTFGAGMMDFDTTCLVPALNEHGELVSENIMDISKKGIRFYNDPSMFEGEIQDLYDLQWMDMSLNKEKNICPKCKEFSMSFEVTELFD